MYADKMTPSMASAIDETNRRRAKQVAYNEANGVEPEPLRKKIHDILDDIYRDAEDTEAPSARGARSSAAAVGRCRAARRRCRRHAVAGARQRRRRRPAWPAPISRS